MAFQADAFQNNAFQTVVASQIAYSDIRDVNIIFNRKALNSLYLWKTASSLYLWKTADSLYLTKDAGVVDRYHDVREYVRD